MADVKLTDHFYLSEATRSQRAAREGIDNSPDPTQLAAIQFTAGRMETVREILGGNIISVSSWLRTANLNAKTPGSSKTSAHMKGYAVDFECRGFGSPYEVCVELSKELRLRGIPYDQIIHEYGSWCHISFDPQNRNQNLTIFKKPGKSYVLGLLTEEEYMK